jgi:hypothetical protein
MKNKSKFRNIIIILLLLILLFPIPMRLKDGGSIRFQALLYSVTKVIGLITIQKLKMSF